MNISEANDVSILLRTLSGEHADADRVVESAERLQERVHKALDAGPRIHDPAVRRAVARIYGDRS